MSNIPQDYADIEVSPPYREAQRVAASVSRKVSLEEYWLFLDEQEILLLDRAKPSNVSFYLDANRLTDYRLSVRLEGYVREPEPMVKKIRRMLTAIFASPEPPPALKGTTGRPYEKKVKLHLPLERQEEVFQRLKAAEFTSVVQAAFARELRMLMRVCKDPDVKAHAVRELQRQYEVMLGSIARYLRHPPQREE